MGGGRTAGGGTETVPPVPSAPWRSDAQAIAEVRSPSSGSVAVAVSVTVVPSSTPDPSAGAESVTFGAPLPTVTVIDAVPVVPRLLVTLAVMRWSPVESVEVLIERPVPIRPSRSDVHGSIGATSPSPLSVAAAGEGAAE